VHVFQHLLLYHANKIDNVLAYLKKQMSENKLPTNISSQMLARSSQQFALPVSIEATDEQTSQRWMKDDSLDEFTREEMTYAKNEGEKFVSSVLGSADKGISIDDAD